MEALVDGALDTKMLSQKLGVEQTGWLTEHLHDLEISGFINRDYTWQIKSGEDSKLSKYRLRDNYLRFYLKYLGKNKNKIERNSFSVKSLANLPAWDIIMGLQFENLVLNNRKAVKTLLMINENEVISDNPFFQTKTTKQPGCQIDYLIQSRFNTLYVCEIKFSKNVIGVEIISEVKAKMERLVKPANFSCRPVLIHVNGVTDDVAESDYFAKIIDFGQLLKGK